MTTSAQLLWCWYKVFFCIIEKYAEIKHFLKSSIGFIVLSQIPNKGPGNNPWYLSTQSVAHWCLFKCVQFLLACLHWSLYLFIHSHLINCNLALTDPYHSQSLKSEFGQVITLWPLNMWTLHHVNWYWIIRWADRLKSIHLKRAGAAHSREWAGCATLEVNLMALPRIKTAVWYCILSTTIGKKCFMQTDRLNIRTSSVLCRVCTTRYSLCMKT